MKSTRRVELELGRHPLERGPLRAVADHDPAQVGVVVAQQPQRAQDVGVALAGDEVADGEDGRAVGLAQRLRRHVGAEVHDARVDRAEVPGALLGAGGVREHQLRRPQRATHHLATLRPVDDGEHVAAVDGDHHRHARPRPPHRVAGGRGVVGVDEVERASSAAARAPASAPPTRPTARRCAAAAARRTARR